MNDQTQSSDEWCKNDPHEVHVFHLTYWHTFPTAELQTISLHPYPWDKNNSVIEKQVKIREKKNRWKYTGQDKIVCGNNMYVQ